ncbi:cytochrome p450 [Moniliophthora roreri MCA 2997]|uniref:Cytochrome p450 n=1 Tax=Moniliophthora roreri (strain MCA 2997) TaxID=1381753 RepID=V2XKV1_MONRO|nr:cytochrome p450 [Moniliophthora roreri MCA 2997]
MLWSHIKYDGSKALVLRIMFLILCLPVITIAFPIFILAIRAKQRSLKFLQGPPNPSLFLGHDYDLLNEKEVGDLEFKWFIEYGTVFRATTCYYEDMLVVADPKALQHIFHKSGYRYKKPKDFVQGAFRRFGPGLTAVQGSQHRRQRKIMNPAFSAAQIKPFVTRFQEHTKSLVIKWREQVQAGQTSIDTVEWFKKMTLDALGETMFDYDFGELQNKNNQLSNMVRNLFVDSVHPGPIRLLYGAARRSLPDNLASLTEYFPTKEDVRWRKWLQTSYSVAKRLYDGKVQEGSSENDVLGVISRSLHSSTPEKALDSEEALAQMSTIILAGNDTSSTMLTWLLYELSRHPEDQKRLLQEIKDTRRKTGNIEYLTANDYEQMPFLNAVIKEAMRLHPIAHTLIRQADVDDIIPLQYPVVSVYGEMLSEIPVVKEQRIMVSISAYNRLKEVWGEDADEWNPSRFLTSKRQTTLGVFGNMMTFGAGVRGCIGWRFAVHEIQTVVSGLVEAFEFSLPPGVEIMRVRAGLMAPAVKGKPKEGVQMPVKIKIRD